MPVNYNADTRRLKTKIKLYQADGVLNGIFTPLGFEVQRVAEDTKFFGQVVCQRFNVKLAGSNNSQLADTSKYFTILIYGADYEAEYPLPPFYINQVNTDEQTGEKSITCYDWIKKTEENTVSQLSLTAPYTIGEFASAIASFYGYEVEYNNISNALINTELTEGANLEGKEKLKDCLQWIAEYLGAIAYVNKDNNLVFRQLNRDGNPLYTVEQDNQFSLKTSDTKRLGKVISATELGDNMEAHTTETGSTQIIRNNPIIEVLNAETVVNNLITALGGITITPFEMQFRGNLNLQIGDKLQINTEEGSITSYLLDETITFDGGLISKMRYHWDTNKEGDENANPSTIGEAIFSTSAKVDKVNKRIDLVVSEVQEDLETINSSISTLTQTANEINATITTVQQDVDGLGNNLQEAIDSTNTTINSLQQQVNAKMTSTEVEIAISEALSNGVDSVTTSTGYRFDKDGLTISKSNSDISTQIDNEGMRVSTQFEDVLTATNSGVNALNLTARNFLIIGTRSRLQDYGTDQTGIFWIGD